MRQRRALREVPQHPLGIPVWKLFSFTFFPKVNKPLPLDERWVLAPEPYAGSAHFHIGYSIERTCAWRPDVQREPVAVILAKHKEYWQDAHFAWPGVDWTRPPAGLEQELGLALPSGFKFVTCVDEMYTKEPTRALPAGVENLCPNGRKLGQAAFIERLSKALLLVGIGRPWISPTPYDALCLGMSQLRTAPRLLTLGDQVCRSSIRSPYGMRATRRTAPIGWRSTTG